MVRRNKLRNWDSEEKLGSKLINFLFIRTDESFWGFAELWWDLNPKTEPFLRKNISVVSLWIFLYIYIYAFRAYPVFPLEAAPFY